MTELLGAIRDIDGMKINNAADRAADAAASIAMAADSADRLVTHAECTLQAVENRGLVVTLPWWLGNLTLKLGPATEDNT